MRLRDQMPRVGQMRADVGVGDSPFPLKFWVKTVAVFKLATLKSKACFSNVFTTVMPLSSLVSRTLQIPANYFKNTQQLDLYSVKTFCFSFKELSQFKPGDCKVPNFKFGMVVCPTLNIEQRKQRRELSEETQKSSGGQLLKC